jgi:anaerobic selenocysteine-containing dehydrogenase
MTDIAQSIASSAESKSDTVNSVDGTHFRTCPLCEATCGLEITIKGGMVARIRGDMQDVFSKGFICPKGSTIKDLDDDPDRLKLPLVRTPNADGKSSTWREVSWEEAFAEIDRGLKDVRAKHGNDSVAIYLGNPNAHSLSSALFSGGFVKSLRTKNVYSASTVDQMPKQLSAGLMFGNLLSIPVPDIDHTDYLLMLGANPYESNGSLMTAPDMPGRIEALKARGGKLVVVDPRRTKTADQGEHIAIKPAGDSPWLLSLIHTIFEEGLVKLAHYEQYLNGLDIIKAIATAPEFSPEATATATGIDAATTRRIARELCAAPTAAVYGRIGTCNQAFGTMASWLIDVLNAVSGNLDRVGGAVFPKPVTGGANQRGANGKGRGVITGRFTSRVRNSPEVFGEFPASSMAEEMTTEGPGQIKALFTIAGNPVLSVPNSDALDAALPNLEFMVSYDMYLNETTKHAHVVLPAPRILAKSHYDVSLYALAIRSVANYSAPVFPLHDYEMAEWEVFTRLAALGSGLGTEVDPAALDESNLLDSVNKLTQTEGSGITGRDPQEIMTMLGTVAGPERQLDLSLRTGPFGDHFGTREGTDFEPLLFEPTSLAHLRNNPHGVDFGALQSRLPDVLRTPTGLIELAPPSLVDDVARLKTSLTQAVASHGEAQGASPDQAPLSLIGRRHIRSNNSWMHNVRVLVKGKPRCTMHMHPDDASARSIVEGATVKVRSSAGSLEVVAEITDSIMPGVVSIPHGWGHDHDDARMTIASQHAGVNTNRLVPSDAIDVLSGNAVTNGIEVFVSF